MRRELRFQSHPRPRRDTRAADDAVKLRDGDCDDRFRCATRASGLRESIRRVVRMFIRQRGASVRDVMQLRRDTSPRRSSHRMSRAGATPLHLARTAMSRCSRSGARSLDEANGQAAPGRAQPVSIRRELAAHVCRHGRAHRGGGSSGGRSAGASGDGASRQSIGAAARILHAAPHTDPARPRTRRRRGSPRSRALANPGVIGPDAARPPRCCGKPWPVWTRGLLPGPALRGTAWRGTACRPARAGYCVLATACWLLHAGDCMRLAAGRVRRAGRGPGALNPLVLRCCPRPRGPRRCRSSGAAQAASLRTGATARIASSLALAAALR